MAADIYIPNPSVGIQNGLVTCLPMPGQVGKAGATNQGSGGFVLSYPVAEPDRVQTVMSADTAEGGAAGRYYVSEELRRQRHGNVNIFQFNVSQTPKQVLAANPARIEARIANNGPNTVFIGPSSATVAASGIPVASGSWLTDDFGASAWWAYAPTGSADVRGQEID